MKTLNIGHNFFVIGGSDRVLIETVKLMNSNGHNAIPFCSIDQRNIKSDYDKYFVKSISTEKPSITSLPSFFYNFDAVEKLKCLLDDNPDIKVAHLHIYYGKITTSILKVLKGRGIKIIQSLHEYKLACPVYTMIRNEQVCRKCIDGDFYNCIINKCKDDSYIKSGIMTLESYFSRAMGDIRNIDTFISVSHFHKKVMVETGIHEDKIKVLHNFVSTKVRHNYKPSHNNYFLYFGRIEKLKGIDTLLEAFVGTEYNLIMAGDGAYSETLSIRLQNIDNISFVGFKSGDDLEKLIDNAIAVVVPSEWYENCPMNILEAKSAGKAVIGSDIGGIPELIEDGQDGYIFPVGDVNKLRTRLHDVLIDFENLSFKALENCQKYFSQDAYYNKLVEIYNS